MNLGYRPAGERAWGVSLPAAFWEILGRRGQDEDDGKNAAFPANSKSGSPDLLHEHPRESQPHACADLYRILLAVAGEQMAQSPFEPLDPEKLSRDLAARVNELMVDPAKRVAFGNARCQRALEVFSWSSIAVQTKRLYESLASFQL